MSISQLRYNEETDRYQIKTDYGYRDLHCGDSFDVLIWDSADRRAKWVPTRIEYGHNWYLCGLVGYQIAGLFAQVSE